MSKKIKIMFNGRSVVGLGSDCVLVPGVNEVAEEVLAKWSKDPVVLDMIKKGTIDEVHEPTQEPETHAPEEKTKRRGRKPKAAQSAQDGEDTGEDTGEGDEATS